ncbi:MAG: protein phosphatase CheZ [Hyphomicrobiales bacterium]|nr:protein phosphatase CheZ [Hyphomicrobiales bacterium]
MQSAPRIFRIERNGAAVSHSDEAASVDAIDIGERRHQQIMRLLLEMRQAQRATPAAESVESTDTARAILEKLKAEISEATELKTELDSIYEAINRTKKEIVTLHETGFRGEEMIRVTDELDAIVTGTERATETVLSSAEIIEERAADLAAKLSGDDQGMAADMQEQVMRIYEACNFQDLTGQRISKVVNALKFIEERVIRMMEIWGGIEGLADVEADKLPEREGDAALLNGPALETDLNVASQDDIDALFD